VDATPWRHGLRQSMSLNRPNRRNPWRLLARPFVGIIVAYAIAISAFAAVISGLHIAAGSNEPGQAFELCIHDAQGGPVSPGEPADRSCVQHCLFCFANLNLAFVAPDGSAARTVVFETQLVSWQADDSRLPQTSRYAIPRPRGPPLSA
jgi:hypothetical protein